MSERAELKLDEHIVDHETQIVLGIRTTTALGHTPEHMVVAIFSGGRQLLCISNVPLHPIHLEQPDWYAAVGFTPKRTVVTRRSLLDGAATEKALILAFYFPFPGLGRVEQKGETWQWQPIETVH